MSPFNFLFGKQNLLEIAKEANDAALHKLILTYGEEHPIFFQGSFREASQEARDTSRLLFVYIHCSDHQDTNKFCSSVLFGNPLIEEYINQNFVFWFGDVSTLEGYKMADELRVTTYPHLSVVHSNGTILKSFHGNISDLRLIQDLTTLEQNPLIQNMQQQNEIQAAQQNELAAARMIREEQEEAYRASLMADQEREEKVAKEREEEERKIAEEAERGRLEKEKQNAKENLFQQKLDNVPEEPSSGDVITLAFRLPNGKRLRRKFSTSNPVQVLYDYVDTRPEIVEQELPPYTLIYNFPKQSFPPSSESLEEAGLVNNSVVDMIFN